MTSAVLSALGDIENLIFADETTGKNNIIIL